MRNMMFVMTAVLAVAHSGSFTFEAAADGGPPCVKARKCDMFVRVRNAGLTRHVGRDASASVRADTRAFRSMALTGPMEVPGFGVPIPSPVGGSDE